jgi:hypothetical protein
MLQVQGQLFKGGTAANGFKLIGNGSYANVYDNPASPGMVLKTSSDQTDAALAWLMFCQYNQGRKGVPVIESLVLDSYGGYACTMKRYKPMNWGYNSREEVMKLLDVNLDNISSFGSVHWCDHENEHISELGDLMAEFEEITDIMCNDIHSGNYMWCPDTVSIIITDPCASSVDIADIAQALQEHYGDVESFELTMQ